MFGKTYYCNHPVYNSCTLYLQNGLGLAVIQQKFNPEEKIVYWSDVDVRLIDDIYRNPNFHTFFALNARAPVGDIYPTVTLRHIMRSLGMKPLRKELWETYFDRNLI